MNLLTHASKIEPGDYVYYYDINGNKKGFGVLVKVSVDKQFPLTKKKLILKNINTCKYWSVKFNKHIIYYKKHVSQQEKTMKNILSLFDN